MRSSVVEGAIKGTYERLSTSQLVYSSIVRLVVAIPRLHAAIAESNRFFRGQIDNNEAIDAGVNTICQKLRLSILQYRVIVTHKQHRSL
jgi:hypothetical protein